MTTATGCSNECSSAHFRRRFTGDIDHRERVSGLCRVGPAHRGIVFALHLLAAGCHGPDTVLGKALRGCSCVCVRHPFSKSDQHEMPLANARDGLAAREPRREAHQRRHPELRRRRVALRVLQAARGEAARPTSRGGYQSSGVWVGVGGQGRGVESRGALIGSRRRVDAELGARKELGTKRFRPRNRPLRASMPVTERGTHTRG